MNKHSKYYYDYTRNMSYEQIKNKKMKINWINSWAKGNKKETICDISVRLGRITLLEIYLNFGVNYRLVVANFGFEI